MLHRLEKTKCENRLFIFSKRWKALSPERQAAALRGNPEIDANSPSFTGSLHNFFSHYNFSQEDPNSIL